MSPARASADRIQDPAVLRSSCACAHDDDQRSSVVSRLRHPRSSPKSRSPTRARMPPPPPAAPDFRRPARGLRTAPLPSPRRLPPRTRTSHPAAPHVDFHHRPAPPGAPPSARPHRFLPNARDPHANNPCTRQQPVQSRQHVRHHPTPVPERTGSCRTHRNLTPTTRALDNTPCSHGSDTVAEITSTVRRRDHGGAIPKDWSRLPSAYGVPMCSVCQRANRCWVVPRIQSSRRFSS